MNEVDQGGVISQSVKVYFVFLFENLFVYI